MIRLLSALSSPLTAIALSAATYAGGYAHGRHDGRTLAEAAIIEKIVEQNERAGDEAELCRDLYRRCSDRGGVFDFAGCACDR